LQDHCGCGSHRDCNTSVSPVFEKKEKKKEKFEENRIKKTR